MKLCVLISAMTVIALAAFISSVSGESDVPLSAAVSGESNNACRCEHDTPSNLDKQEGLRVQTELVNPSSLYDGRSVGMSQAKIDLESGLIFVSGQVDWNADSQVQHATMEGQADGAIQNLLKVLAEAKSSVDELLQVRVYVRGELADHMATVVPIFARYLGTARPALTGIGVASLASRDTLIEIEAVAKTADRRKAPSCQ